MCSNNPSKVPYKYTECIYNFWLELLSASQYRRVMAHISCTMCTHGLPACFNSSYYTCLAIPTK